jgi:hypothetical protein
MTEKLSMEGKTSAVAEIVTADGNASSEVENMKFPLLYNIIE